MAEAGWYPDTTNEGWLAYWDGDRWTGDRQPMQAQPMQAQPMQAQPMQAQPMQAQPPAQNPFEQTTRLSDLRAEQLQHQASQLPADPQQTWQPPAEPGWQPPAEPEWLPPAAPVAPAAPAQHYAPQQFGVAQPPWPGPNTEQQAWQQPGWQQPGQPPVQQPGWQQPGWQQPAPPSRRSRKKLIIAAAAVVVVAAGLLTWLLLPGDGPSLTYNGKDISSAGKVLSTAEGQLRSAVKVRHGATNGDTRCYFAKPKKEPAGKKSTDVQNSLRCGPVLFIDGDKSRAWLDVALRASTNNGKAELTSAAASFATAQPQAVPGGLTLARPDGQSAPQGNDGLAVPQPPSAPANVLTAVTLGPSTTPKVLDNAVMTGRTTKVTLTAAGTVDRYGTGDNARKAPAGQQLVAFQLAYGPGDVDDTGTTKAKLVVAGQPARALPATTDGDQWIVAAVPTSGTAQLELADGGFTQTLTLPGGKPGAGNLAVLTRTHRTAILLGSFDVSLHLTKPGASGNAVFHARTSVASLDFWVPRHTDHHASGPTRAILSVGLTYTDSKDPGKIFGFDPQLVSLRLPNGQVVHSRNVAAAGKVDDVFDVPATFTRGRVQISGSETLQGIHVHVTKTKSFAVSIAAG